jgi:hypothetical protein
VVLVGEEIMPAKYFLCPDNETIPITQCLADKGCRMKTRCSTRSFLRLIGFDRKWEGVTPSAAGNGPRYLYLKATVDYIIDPNGRVWAALGTSTHDNLGMHEYNKDILAEEKLSDEKMKGIADCLEIDENKDFYFVLTDYKTWGSYKVAKSLGIISEKVEETILDDEGKPVLLKTGKNAGQASPKPSKKQLSPKTYPKLIYVQKNFRLIDTGFFLNNMVFLLAVCRSR